MNIFGNADTISILHNSEYMAVTCIVSSELSLSTYHQKSVFPNVCKILHLSFSILTSYAYNERKFSSMLE